MGSFRDHNRNGSFNRGRSGGGSGRRFGGGFGGGRDRDGGRGDRGPAQMYDVVCSKCGKNCQVPFKPTGSKPVFCSECFRENEGSTSRFSSRNQNASSQSGSQDLSEINAKLDKIINILQQLELEPLDEEDSDNEEDEDLGDEEEIEEDSEEDLEDEEESDEEESEEESEEKVKGKDR